MNRARGTAALLCVATLAVAGCSDGGDSGAKTTGSSTTASSATTATTGPGTITTQPGYVTLPAVGVGEPSPLGDKLFATVTKVDPVTLKAAGPGDVAGPGVVVTVEIRNDTGRPVNLDLIAVNASYGADLPASPNRAGGTALAGQLESGSSKTGTYGFRVPSGPSGTIVIDIQHSGAPNIVTVNATA